MAALSYEPGQGISPREYLEMERRAEQKHEYRDGEVWAMAGASTNHNRININIAASIYNQLRGSSCETMSNDQRVRIPDTRHYTYPDVVVVCGQPRFDDEVGAVDTITNPVAIIEVLSSSTETDDRGDKFTRYRRIESLRDYILVSQTTMHVEHYARQDDHSWLLREYQSPLDLVQLSGAPATLRLSDVYERVQFEVAPHAPDTSSPQ